MYLNGISIPTMPTPPTATALRLLERDDVVLVKGRHHLVNRTLTPLEAMVEDLLAIRAALDSAGIDHLLVRDGSQRPVLAVELSQRDALISALETACAGEPFYAKVVRPTAPTAVLVPTAATPGDGSRGKARPALVADGALSADPGARLFRLFRPRVEPSGGLRYGASTGVQIELWSFGTRTVEAPDETALTKLSTPAADLVRVEVVRHGCTWRTIENMFADHASDITFEIDLVFSWVDGSSDEWQRARAARMRSYVVGAGDDSDARFRQVDELRYALRSVRMFAPWIRRIFVATDSPRPAWLAEHPGVTLVRSEEFFADPSVLPTHNSHAVESQLHHIDGLAEHFLYANDDMFFGRAARPETFFSPGGVSKFVEAGTRIGLGESDPARSGFENAARVNRGVLVDRFGRITTRHLEHVPTPLRRSVLARMEAELPTDFARTAASRFRAGTDISVTNSLYHYYALMTGEAVTQTGVRAGYVDTTARAGLAAMAALLAARDIDMFCLNDGSFPEIDAQTRAREVTDFLRRYFPIAAPWELPD